MRPFILILVIAAIAALAFLADKLIKRAQTRSVLASAESYGRNREYMVYGMLKSSFPSRSIYRNLYFPVSDGPETLWTEVDALAVTHGGIVVIEIKGAKGVIENPVSGDWTQRYKEKVLTFQNPYEQNEGHIIAVKNALRSAGIGSVPMFNVVVFTEKNVRFTKRYPWLMDADRLIDYVAALEDRNTLKRKDIKQINQIIGGYRVRHDATAAERARTVRSPR